MGETDGQLSGLLEYNTDLFDAATAGRMAAHFRRLLESAVANPEEQVSRLPLLSEAEREQILFGWNETRAARATLRCIHELFERQAQRTPEAVALASKDERLSYGELNRRANLLAHHLRGLGVGPEMLVAIRLERSAEAVVAILGVLKAGGGYLPIDPRQPPERLSFMLADAGVKVLLTQEHLLAGAQGQKIRTLCLDRDWPAIARESAENPGSGVIADNPAYLTSQPDSLDPRPPLLLSGASRRLPSALTFRLRQFGGRPLLDAIERRDARHPGGGLSTRPRAPRGVD
jgi:non-ribosomal peptide synthetase component F